MWFRARTPRRCVGVWRHDGHVYGCVMGRDHRVIETFKTPLSGDEAHGASFAAALRKLGGAPLVFPVDEAGMVLRSLRVPNLSDRETASAVGWEMQLLLSDATEEHLIRHVVVGDSGDQRDILAVAVPREPVRAAIRHLSSVGGSSLLGVDVTACALWRAARLADLVPGRDGAVMLACPGADSILTVVGAEHPTLARLITTTEPYDLGDTIAYFENKHRQKVTARYWAGPDMPEEFQPLRVPDLLDGEFAMAAGLALWPYMDPRMNLLTRETRIGTNYRAIAAWTAAAVLTAGAAGLGITGADYRQEAVRLGGEVAALRTAVAEASQDAQVGTRYERWQGVVERFLNDLTPRAPLIGRVRQCVPPEVYLRRVELSPSQARDDILGLPAAANRLVVEGRSVDMASIGVLRDNLADALKMDSVRIVRVMREERDDGSMFTFRIEGVIGGGM